MEGTKEELKRLQVDTLAKLETASTNILVDSIPKLSENILITSFEDMQLWYHPYASLFKFSVKHPANDKCYSMSSLTQVVIWLSACKPSMTLDTVLVIIAREIEVLQLPVEHRLEFLVIKSYAEEYCVCES